MSDMAETRSEWDEGEDRERRAELILRGQWAAERVVFRLVKSKYLTTADSQLQPSFSPAFEGISALALSSTASQGSQESSGAE